MSETLPLDELRKQSSDIFEQVIIAARRAKQINALRMAKYPLPTVGTDNEESFDETPEEDETTNWDEIEKPTTLALNELLEGKINYRYATEPEETSNNGEEDSASEISE
jgi:DNA-directed RNA polymerase omega subunit